MAPYMPAPMCISTGGVPQWYMKAPGYFGVKLQVNSSPGLTSGS